MIGFKCLTPSCQSFGAENLTFRQRTGNTTEKRPTENPMFCISVQEIEYVFVLWIEMLQFLLLLSEYFNNQTVVLIRSIAISEKMHLITLFEGMCRACTHMPIQFCYRGLKCVFDTTHDAKHST